MTVNLATAVNNQRAKQSDKKVGALETVLMVDVW